MVIKREKSDKDAELPTWLDADGIPLGCLEKIKVLNENILEIRDMCQDALEDAVLMGCDEIQIRIVLSQIVKNLQEPFENES